MVIQKTIVILGGGIGGLTAANELHKKAGKDTRIILIDKNDQHVYSPSFLWLMLGKRKAENIQKTLTELSQKGIEFVHEEVINIDPETKSVKTQSKNFQYDYLVISLGAELAPQNISGLIQSGYNLYELNEVERLRDDLKNFLGGKVAVVISSLPFKCPAAPYEAVFLLNEYFQKKGLGDKTEIAIFTPEPFPMPGAGSENGKAIQVMIERRNIKFNPEMQLLSVNASKKELVFENNATSQFDLLIFIPPHQGPKAIRNSGIGNEAGWISVDRKTLKTKYENIFAIGDVATITLVSGKPLPKAGVFAHSEAKVVAENIASEIHGSPINKEYNGHASCFLEVGYGKAGLAVGNFYAEPVPAITLRGPGRIWRWGKVLFEKYWLWKYP